MESDIIHVTEGTQFSAKQTFIMTEEMADIQILKGLSIIQQVSSVFVWKVPSKACQSSDETRAVQRGITATG